MVERSKKELTLLRLLVQVLDLIILLVRLVPLNISHLEEKVQNIT